jgi:hypothetical protein
LQQRLIAATASSSSDKNMLEQAMPLPETNYTTTQLPHIISDDTLNDVTPQNLLAQHTMLQCSETTDNTQQACAAAAV